MLRLKEQRNLENNMGLWIFTTATVLLIPAIMMIFGLAFRNKAPKEINYIFGYRTARSMKTQETWEFAHLLLGKIWFRCGLTLLVISLVLMLLVLGKDQDIIGNFGMIITYVELGVLIVTIIPVEKALKKNFDKDGKRKD